MTTYGINSGLPGSTVDLRDLKATCGMHSRQSGSPIDFQDSLSPINLLFRSPTISSDSFLYFLGPPFKGKIGPTSDDAHWTIYKSHGLQ